MTRIEEILSDIALTKDMLDGADNWHVCRHYKYLTIAT